MVRHRRRYRILRGTWHRRPEGQLDRGSSAVELAILMPAILIAFFAGIQVAALFVARTIALTAAEQSTTAQRAYNAPPGIGEERANAFLDQTGDWLTNRQVRVIPGDTEITTIVEGQALSLIPGVTFHVEQHSRGSIERFTTEERP